jgi:hypothetical protein
VLPHTDRSARDREQRHTVRRRVGLGFAVAAAALAGTSGYFAWRASVAGDDVSGTFVPGNRWNDGAQASERDGLRSDRLAIETGVAAIIAAGVAAWLRWK